MANRRMFSKVITNSDLFLDMPPSTQLLYFHLGMNADDDGFVQLRATMRTLGSTEDDAKVLFAKRLLIRFDDGVVVIKDWRINNEIRVDRYKATIYQEHLKQLSTDDTNSYVLGSGIRLVLPNDNQKDTQVRLGKVRLGKNNTESESDIRKSKSYLTEIPKDDVDYFTTKYDLTERSLFHKADELLCYVESHGKVYKNYKAFLENAVRKDFKYRPKSTVPDYPDVPINEEGRKKLEEMRSKVFNKIS